MNDNNSPVKADSQEKSNQSDIFQEVMEKMKDIKAEREMLIEENNYLQGNLKRLYDEIKRLDTTNNELRNQLHNQKAPDNSNSGTSEEIKAKLDLEIKELKDKIKQLEEEKNNLSLICTSQHNAIKNYTAEILILAEERNKFRNNCENMEKAYADCFKNSEMLCDDNKKLKEKIRHFEKEKILLVDKLNHTEILYDELQRETTEGITMLEGTNQKLQQQIKTQQKTIEQLMETQQKTIFMSQQKAPDNSNSGISEETKAALAEQKAIFKDEIQRYMKEEEQLYRKIENLKKENNKLDSICKSQEETIKEYRAEKNKEIMRLEQECEKFKRDYENSEEERGMCFAIIKNLEKDNKNLREETKNLEMEINNLEEAKNKLDKICKSQSEIINDYRNKKNEDVMRLSRERDEFKTMFKDCLKNSQELDKQKEELEKYIKKLKAVCEKQKNTINKLSDNKD